jgi:beta-lactamase superfamily II metal-dependent hydrolase
MPRKKRTRIFPFLAVILILALCTLYYFDLLPIPSFLPSDGTTASLTTEGTADTRLPGNDVNVGTSVDAATINTAALSIHFLELGNKYTGDCTYIKVGDVDILIDAGSRVGSIATISEYLNDFVTDGILEYVIVTHAHQDHYAGFATGTTTDSIFDLYECKTIIDFALTNQKSDAKMYSNYVRERNDEVKNGATHYTAADCIQNDKNVFFLSDSVSLEILDSYYYYNTSSDENNYSVCCLIREGDRSYLFTGDLEHEGESYLVDMNTLPEVELFKAGHHGSPTSSTAKLLEAIKPKHIAVCCCAGSPEYTENVANQFPSQAFIDRIAPYTRNVFVTTLCIDYKNAEFISMNGNIVFLVKDNTLTVSCSASTLPLYQSEWFSTYRTCPDAWKEAS